MTQTKRVMKSLWAHKSTGELLVKVYGQHKNGTPIMALTTFSREELMQKGGESLFNNIVELEATRVIIEEPIEETPVATVPEAESKN